MTATLTLPPDASFRWCHLCARPGRLHLAGVCQMCETFPRRCTWAQGSCPLYAVATARSPFRYQLGEPDQLVCEEHVTSARLAGWEVRP